MRKKVIPTCCFFHHVLRDIVLLQHLCPLYTSLPQVFDHGGSFRVECHHCLQKCITSLCNYPFKELVICAAATATCNTALSQR